MALRLQAMLDGRLGVAYFRDPLTAEQPLDGAWASPAVIAWLEPNAIVWSGPLDANAEIAAKSGITKPETVIVWAADGSELACGPVRTDPDAMLTVLTESRELARAIYQARRDLALCEDDEVLMHHLLCGTAEAWGQLDDLTEEYKWLWQNIPDLAPTQTASRASFMVSHMRNLAARHAAARREFTLLRDALADQVAEGVDEVIEDWALLNYVIDEDAATVRWFAALNDADAGALESAVLAVERALVRQQEWRQAVRLHPRPVEETVRWLRLSREMDGVPRRDEDRMPAEVKQKLRRGAMGAMYARVATIYSIFLAAGLDERASDIASAARHDEPTGQMELELDRAAAGVGKVRPEHADWLQRARDQGVDTTEVEALLANQK